MNESNITSNPNMSNVNVKTISLIFGKAAKIIEHRALCGELDAEGARLVGDLWFSFKLISDLQSLDDYIDLVGLDRFCSLLAAMSCLEWGEDDKILCAYLEHEFNLYDSMYNEQLHMEAHVTMH